MITRQRPVPYPCNAKFSLNFNHSIGHKIPVLTIAHVPHLVTNQFCPAYDRSAAPGIVSMSIKPIIGPVLLDKAIHIYLKGRI